MVLLTALGQRVTIGEREKKIIKVYNLYRAIILFVHINNMPAHSHFKQINIKPLY